LGGLLNEGLHAALGCIVAIPTLSRPDNIFSDGLNVGH
jgi:hypothetical protein